MVEFEDNSVIAQLSAPDMRLPISYALTYPERKYCKTEKIDFFALKNITFDKPDTDTFRCLKLAYDASATGGSMPAVLNAAIFVGVLIAVKLIGGTPGGWGDCGWILLICILAGGTVSGLWRGEKKRRRRSVGVRMCSKGRG
jgi:hypothetical protein